MGFIKKRLSFVLFLTKNDFWSSFFHHINSFYIMSKFNELMADYKAQLSGIGVTADEVLLTAVAKGLGPSIYNKDSAMVSCSDSAERERLKANFLIKKLGMTDSAELDAAIEDVCNQVGSSVRNKYRPVFYYLLVKKLGKESVYA